MFESDPVLYDRLTDKFEHLIASSASRLPANASEEIASMLSFEAVMSTTSGFVTRCEEMLRQSPYDPVSEDLNNLRRRISDAIGGIDGDRVRALDVDYCLSAYKQCIDILATPNEVEEAYLAYEETSPLWNATMNLYRQIQAFYEAKVTFGDISELDNNR